MKSQYSDAKKFLYELDGFLSGVDRNLTKSAMSNEAEARAVHYIFGNLIDFSRRCLEKQAQVTPANQEQALITRVNQTSSQITPANQKLAKITSADKETAFPGQYLGSMMGEEQFSAKHPYLSRIMWGSQGPQGNWRPGLEQALDTEQSPEVRQDILQHTNAMASHPYWWQFRQHLSSPNAWKWTLPAGLGSAAMTALFSRPREDRRGRPWLRNILLGAGIAPLIYAAWKIMSPYMRSGQAVPEPTNLPK